MSTEALREKIRAQVRQALAAAPGGDGSVAALMQRFEAGYAAVNAEAIVACFAPDVVWTLPDGRVLQGRPACLNFLKERFASPMGPKFSDSHMHVLGQTVVQNYKVTVPLPGGQSVTRDGTDVYEIRNGLIARKDAYWKQVAVPAAAAAAAPAAVTLPLRLGSEADAHALTDLLRRLAASPALMQASRAGLLRLDLQVGAPAAGSATSAMAATTAVDPAACCSSCKQGKACECTGPECSLHAHDSAALLEGVIGERQVKALAPAVKSVRLGSKAVMTPLGKDALRKRGITIERGDSK